MVKKLYKVPEMKLKTYTPAGLKFLLEKVKFKVSHYVHLNFIGQRQGLKKDQTSIFKSLVILKYRHTF